MSINQFYHSIFPELVTQSNLTLKCNVSVISDCLSVVNVDHTDGHYKHYMSHHNPISYKHVESHQGITLMDITCLFITLFHINMLDFPLGITLMDITCFIITWWTLQIPQLSSFLRKFIIFIYIYFDKDTKFSLKFNVHQCDLCLTFLSLLASYTCTVNWFCVHLYSKLVLCTLVQ